MNLFMYSNHDFIEFSPYLVVLPLSTTDSSCGTLHFTLTVIINSSSKALDHKEKLGRNEANVCRHSSSLAKSAHLSTDSFKDKRTGQNTTYKCMKQPVSVPSLSTSVNTTPSLPESFTNQDNTTRDSSSFTVNNPIMIADIPLTKKPTSSKLNFKPRTPSHSRTKNIIDQGSSSNMESSNAAGSRLHRFRRLSSTEVSTDISKVREATHHTRRSLRNNIADVKDTSKHSQALNGAIQKKDNSNHTQAWNGSIQKKILSKTSSPLDISLVAVSSKSNSISNTIQRKMSAPTIPFSTYKLTRYQDVKFSNTKLMGKNSNTKQLQDFEAIRKNGKMKKQGAKISCKNQATSTSNNFPSQQQVQRVSYILSVSSAASLQPSPSTQLGSLRSFRKSAIVTTNIDKNASLAPAIKRTGSDNNLCCEDPHERLQTPSPNKRANTNSVTDNCKAIEPSSNGISGEHLEEKMQVDASSLCLFNQISTNCDQDSSVVENNKTKNECVDDCDIEDKNSRPCETSLHVASASTYTQTQHPAVPPLPPRGNLRLHPAVLRKGSQQAQYTQAKTSLVTAGKNKVLFRQSFPNSNKETNINLMAETTNSSKVKQLRKQNTLAQITVVSVTGGSSVTEGSGTINHASSISGLSNSTNRSSRNHPLHRQCAVQSSLSIDTGGVANEAFSSNSNTLQLQNTLSIESVEGQTNHMLHRRPRSLIHQSAGSLQSFSLFGSVDSEQSVPRTAPLATPEQELSLLEMASFENLPLDSVLHQGCVVHFGANITLNTEVGGILPESKGEFEHQHSLDAISNDIFFHQLPTSPKMATSSVTTDVEDGHNASLVNSLPDDNKENEEDVGTTNDNEFGISCRIITQPNLENDDPMSKVNTNRNILNEGKKKCKLSGSSTALENLSSGCSVNVCRSVLICSKSSENITCSDTEKKAFLQSKFIKTAQMGIRENYGESSQIGAIAVNDVNFMDLSCSSSNQESPESQTMETDTGILSSNDLGLNSPTNVNSDEKCTTNTLSPSLSPNQVTQTKQQHNLKVEGDLPTSSETILRSPAEIDQLENIPHSDNNYLDNHKEKYSENIHTKQLTLQQQSCKNYSNTLWNTVNPDRHETNLSDNIPQNDKTCRKQKRPFLDSYTTSSTIFNFEVTPPPPLNVNASEKHPVFNSLSPSSDLCQDTNVVNSNPLPDVVPRQGQMLRNKHTSFHDDTKECHDSLSSQPSSSLENDYFSKEEQEHLTSSSYIPLTYSAAHTMAIPITSQSMIRSPQPPDPVCNSQALHVINNGSNQELNEIIDDEQPLTAFPFPTISPNIKKNFTNSANERQNRSTRSRPSMVKLERHDSTTSSSSGSNGVNGEQDTTDISTENIKDTLGKEHQQRKNVHHTGAQYHTREGYPKVSGCIRKFNSNTASVNETVDVLAVKRDREHLPRVAITDCELTNVPGQVKRSASDEEFNCGNIITSGNDKTTTPTTPISSEPSATTVRITTLPSIPKRSTYRVELQPGVELPPCK